MSARPILAVVVWAGGPVSLLLGLGRVAGWPLTRFCAFLPLLHLGGHSSRRPRRLSCSRDSAHCLLSVTVRLGILGCVVLSSSRQHGLSTCQGHPTREKGGSEPQDRGDPWLPRPCLFWKKLPGKTPSRRPARLCSPLPLPARQIIHGLCFDFFTFLVVYFNVFDLPRLRAERTKECAGTTLCGGLGCRGHEVSRSVFQVLGA